MVQWAGKAHPDQGDDHEGNQGRTPATRLAGPRQHHREDHVAMATFGAWLDAQKNRPEGDPLGELARYWDGVKGTRKIRALPSIESTLREAGAFAEGSPVTAWWEKTVAEYRRQRTGSLASGDLHVVPPAEEPAAPPGQDGPAGALEGIIRYLAAIAVRLGMSAGEVQRLAEQAMGPRTDSAPIDWRALAAVADHEAEDAG